MGVVVRGWGEGWGGREGVLTADLRRRSGGGRVTRRRGRRQSRVVANGWARSGQGQSVVGDDGSDGRDKHGAPARL